MSRPVHAGSLLPILWAAAFLVATSNAAVPVAGCVTAGTSCTDTEGDCCASTDFTSDPMTCSNGGEVATLLEQGSCASSKYEYQCCDVSSATAGLTCDNTKCSSPGVVGDDCWAVGGVIEKCTCSSGTARLTGLTLPVNGLTYRHYTCCIDGAGNEGESCGVDSGLGGLLGGLGGLFEDILGGGGIVQKR